MNKRKNMIFVMKTKTFCGFVMTLLLLVLPFPVHGEELQLNSGQLKAFLEGKIAEKIEEAFIASANSAEGTVRNATYFNEILRDYEDLGLLETNFAQTAVELYRSYQEALKNDAEEDDPEKKTNASDFIRDNVKSAVAKVLTSVLDKESQEIVSSLKNLWADAQERLKKITEAKQYIAEHPEAEVTKVLIEMGLSGTLIDDMEFVEVNYRGLKNMSANYVEAFNALVTVTGALKSSDPGSKIETLFSLGAEFGGRIPVLGMFVQKYFEVAQEMIKACKGLGTMIRSREGFCVGGTTTGQMDTSLGGDPRNIQWIKQFPKYEACPESQVGIYRDIYKEVGNAENIFFWVKDRFIAGQPHGGMKDLQALIQWLRRNGYQAQAADVAFLAKAYNIRPGFLQREKEIKEKAQELQREIHRLVDQLLCESEVTEEFLLKAMGIQGIIEGIEMDLGLVRSFPYVDEIVDKVIEERLIKGSGGFHQKLLNVLGKVKNTMAFRIQGRVTDGSGKGLEEIALEASPERNVIDDCSSLKPDAQGFFRITCVKSPTDSLSVRIKATNVKDEVEEATVNASGSGDEYKCDIVFTDAEQIVSLVITPEKRSWT